MVSPPVLVVSLNHIFLSLCKNIILNNFKLVWGSYVPLPHPTLHWEKNLNDTCFDCGFWLSIIVSINRYICKNFANFNIF